MVQESTEFGGLKISREQKSQQFGTQRCHHCFQIGKTQLNQSIRQY